MAESSLASEPGPAPTRSWVRRRVVDPVVTLLRQGSSPREVSLAIAIGAVIGVFPVFGTPTGLCLAIALATRLNIVAMQVGNYVVYPIQLALIIPFIRAGERLFGAPRLQLSLDALVVLFRGGTLHAVGVLWQSLMYAAVAWLIVAPIVGLALYTALLPVVRRLASAYAAARAPSTVL